MIRMDRLCIAALLLLSACAGAGQPARSPGDVPQAAEALVIEVSIESIPAGGAVLVGELDLEGGALRFDLSAEDGSGLFVGLYPRPDITQFAGTTWSLYLDGSLPLTGDERTVHATNGVGDLRGTYYCYVGSAEEGLAAVSGSITWQP